MVLVLTLTAGVFGFDKAWAGMQRGRIQFLSQLLGEDARPVMRQFMIGRMKGHLELAEKLNLTPEQKEQIGRIIARHRQAVAPVIAEVIEKKEALSDLIWAETADEDAIRRASADLAGAVEKAAVVMAGLFQEGKTVLTPEQQAIYKAFRDSQKESSASLLGKLRQPPANP